MQRKCGERDLSHAKTQRRKEKKEKAREKCPEGKGTCLCSPLPKSGRGAGGGGRTRSVRGTDSCGEYEPGDESHSCTAAPSRVFPYPNFRLLPFSELPETPPNQVPDGTYPVRPTDFLALRHAPRFVPNRNLNDVVSPTDRKSVV